MLLLADVARYGRKGNIVEVPDGYAKNVLIPKHLARPLTEAQARTIAQQQEEQLETKRKQRAALLAQIRNCLQKHGALIIPARANESGRLYTTVRDEHILEQLEHTCAIRLPKDIAIQEHPPIKTVGSYTLTLTLSNKAVCTLSISVQQE